MNHGACGHVGELSENAETWPVTLWIRGDPLVLMKRPSIWNDILPWSHSHAAYIHISASMRHVWSINPFFPHIDCI